MRKTLIIALSTVVLLIAVYAMRVSATPQAEIAQLPQDYQALGQQCLERGSFNCCMASVKTMAKGGYRQASEFKSLEDEGCPKGYRRNILRCIDSFAWCEPVQSP